MLLKPKVRINYSEKLVAPLGHVEIDAFELIAGNRQLLTLSMIAIHEGEQVGLLGTPSLSTMDFAEKAFDLMMDLRQSIKLEN